MSSSAVVAAVSRQVIRPVLSRASVESPLGRLMVRGLVVAPALLPLPLPDGVAVTRSRSPRGEWVRPVDGPGDEAVLFLHGGGYVAGSARGYRHAVALVARASRCDVLGLDYRRAPEHRRPAQLDDALAAYRQLRHRYRTVHLMGDSAGAHLAVELVATLPQRGLEGPRRVALFSPLLRPESPLARDRDRRSPDPVVSPAFADRCIAAVRAREGEQTDALAVLAGARVHPLPRFGTWTGSTECFADDATALADLLLAADPPGPHHHEVLDGQVHSFLALSALLPSAAAAAARAGWFLGGS